MAVEHPDSMQWERVANELRAAREAQQRTWGDLDNVLLGRYLADEATTHERAEVEAALETLPDLKLLTDLVRDVLADSGPAAPPQPVAVPTVAARTPAPLSLRRPAPFVRKVPWLSRQRVAVLAAACLFLALGLWRFQPGKTHPHALDSVTLQGDPVASLTRNGTLRSFAESDKEPISVTVVLDDAVRQLDDPQIAARKADSLAAADHYSNIALHVTEKRPDLESDPDVAPKLARGWNRAGAIYQKEGKSEQAKHALVKANDVCCNLASVYQQAVPPPAPLGEAGAPLAMAMRLAPRGTEANPIAPEAEEPKAKFIKDVPDAAARRARLKQPEAQQQLRDNVVPVLASAIQSSSLASERARLAFALGNLGPVARNAAPTLIEALRKATDARERFALIRALAHMGPPTAEAVPVLVQTVKECDADLVRRSAAYFLLQAPTGKKQLNEWATHGTVDEKELAKQVLQRPRGGR